MAHSRAITTVIVRTGICGGPKVHRERKKERREISVPLLIYIDPGACRKTPVMLQNRWPKLKLNHLGDCEVSCTDAVAIAGGGPTGLMLAGELALAGIDVAIVERRASQPSIG